MRFQIKIDKITVYLQNVIFSQFFQPGFQDTRVHSYIGGFWHTYTMLYFFKWSDHLVNWLGNIGVSKIKQGDWKRMQGFLRVDATNPSILLLQLP
jgi:hypothetical protein